MLHKIASWAKGNRRSLMGLSLLAIGLAAFMALGPDPVNAKAANYLAKLWINDTFLIDQALFSDGEGEYIDHRISPPVDRCVTAWVTTDGFFFIYMDYTGETGHKCSENLGVPLRTYTLRFPEPWGGETVAEDSPRMRIEKLFGRKGTTPIAFMFYRDGVSYEVRTDLGVSITGAGNTRTLTYHGTAKLWRITTPKESGPITDSFWFPFQLTVERVPQ